MIKILFFLNCLTRDEVVEHVLAILKGLDRGIFVPTVVAPEDLIFEIHKELDDYKVNYYKVCIRKWTDFVEIKKFMDVLRKVCPMIVHSHKARATFYAGPLCRYAKVPIIMDTAHERETWNGGYDKPGLIDYFVYKSVDHVIAVADAMKKYLMEAKDVPADKITVVKNGVDTERYKPGGYGGPSDSPKQSKVSSITLQDQKALNITEDARERTDRKLSIGVIGRVEELKGHRYLLEAVEMMGGRKETATFLIIGDGRLKLPLKQLAERKGISDHVHFLGPKKYILDVFNTLDIVVIPSLAEGLPAIALQASSMAKAIVASNVDGLAEVIVPDKTGLLVPPQDSGALKDALVRLMDDADLREELGRRARQHVCQNFHVSRQVKETEEVYKQEINKLKDK
jgi:glycosyltransferase involved in cell wall biosynthesis